MAFVFDDDNRPSDSSLVDVVWRDQSRDPGTFMSVATSYMGMVITKQKDRINFTVHGPLTRAFPAPIPQEAEFLGIIFKLGTFMPHLPIDNLVDAGINLPEARSHSFWLHNSTWQLPTFENADEFVNKLIRYGVIAYDPVVGAALEGQIPDLSARSVQRRFRRVTGLTHGEMHQIERAHHAMMLLQDGVSILDTVEQAGYYDQPHLTRSLKHFIGQTPAQILDIRKNE